MASTLKIEQQGQRKEKFMNEMITYKGFNIIITPDDYAESPRTFFDNLGTMICFHKRYNLGDKTEYNSDNFNSWTELEKQLKKDGAVIIAPLWLYDHSGLRIKIGNFAGLLPQGHAEFDTGQIGFIFATAETLKEEYNTKRLTKTILEKAQKVLQDEVKTYDHYLSGAIYSYIIQNPDGDTIDSLSGFYGDIEESGLMTEAESAIESYLENKTVKHIKLLKKYIKNNTPLIYRKGLTFN
jgi:hypothetical protein